MVAIELMKKRRPGIEWAKADATGLTHFENSTLFLVWFLAIIEVPGFEVRARLGSPDRTEARVRSSAC